MSACYHVDGVTCANCSGVGYRLISPNEWYLLPQTTSVFASSIFTPCRHGAHPSYCHACIRATEYVGKHRKEEEDVD